MFKGNSHPKPCDRDQLVLKSEVSSLFWQSLWKVFPLPLGDFFNWSLLVEKLVAEGYFLKRNLAVWPQNLGFASTPWLVPVRRDSMRWRHPRGGSTEDLRRPLGGGFQSARTDFDIFWQLILHDMHPQHEAFEKIVSFPFPIVFDVQCDTLVECTVCSFFITVLGDFLFLFKDMCETTRWTPTSFNCSYGANCKRPKKTAENPGFLRWNAVTPK